MQVMPREMQVMLMHSQQITTLNRPEFAIVSNADASAAFRVGHRHSTLTERAKSIENVSSSLKRSNSNRMRDDDKVWMPFGDTDLPMIQKRTRAVTLLDYLGAERQVPHQLLRHKLHLAAKVGGISSHL
jgi:hypothetical protein